MFSITTDGLYAVAITLPILGTSAVAARFYVRRQKKAGLGVDDWTSLAALTGLWVIAALALTGTARKFFGTHTLQDPQTGGIIVTKESANVRYQWVVLLVTIISITLIKLSAVFLYRRLFQVNRVFNIYTIVLSIVLAVWAVVFLFANIFQCGTRPWAFWTGAKAIIKYCYDTEFMTMAFCATDLLLDVVVLLSPMPIIWRLHVSTTRKLQVLGVFAVGLLSTAASAARLYVMYLDGYGSTLGARDVIGQNSEVVTFSMVEVAVALIACCLPILRPLFSSESKGIGSIIRAFQSMRSLGSVSAGSLHKEGSEDGRTLKGGPSRSQRSEKVYWQDSVEERVSTSNTSHVRDNGAFV